VVVAVLLMAVILSRFLWEELTSQATFVGYKLKCRTAAMFVVVELQK
jgi:hypothetical protein